MENKIRKGYDFDDVMLIPRLSNVNSRTEVDLSIDLGKLKLNIPIIASPMKGIISIQLIQGLSELGGIGILHRFFKERNDLIFSLNKLNGYTFGVSASIKDRRLIEIAADYGAKIFCIDVANGYTLELLKTCDYISNIISKNNYDILLMAGNVVTYEGAKSLKDSGVDLVRVGIGSGQLCTTRIITGIGVPQITAINDCSYSDAIIVADGGIRTSGDAVKALAAGADLVMLGSLFGKTFESAHNGIIYGMASRTLQEEYYHSVKSIEGIEKEIDKKISLADFINEFIWGIKSAFTYLGVRNINELHANISMSDFIETTWNWFNKERGQK